MEYTFSTLLRTYIITYIYTYICHTEGTYITMPYTHAGLDLHDCTTVTTEFGGSPQIMVMLKPVSVA
jgi:hypothetical protein